MKKIILLFVMVTLINLANANDVIKLYDKQDKTINIKVWFNVGSQLDPAGKEGLCYLTAKLLAEGNTKTLKYSEILDKLYPFAASYNVRITNEMTVFNASVHKDKYNEFIKIFTDALLNPAFDDADIERIKSEMLTYLESTLPYQNDEELGKALLYNELFKNTPYGHLSAGTISGIKNISKDDIFNFYKTYFNRNNYTIAISGDFTDKFITALNNELMKLPDGKKAEKPVFTISQPQGHNAIIFEKDANATAISIGTHLPLLRGTKDWYALAVANSYLGEHRNSVSHLYQVIRAARGLNYGDYSYIEHFPNGGSLNMPPQNICRRYQLFEIWIRPVPNETRYFVIKTVLYELDKLYKNGLTKEQFEKQRNFLKNYINFYAQSNYERLGYMVDDAFYGIKEGHLNLFKKYLNKITYEDVQAAIKKYLNPDNLLFVIITKNGEELKNQLENNPVATISYSTPKPNEVLDEDKIIGNYPVKFNNLEIRQINKEVFNK